MLNNNSGNSKNVMALIVSLLLTISVLAILTIYTFQTIIVTKKIERALDGFKNNSLKILLPSETYTNVNINLVTNYLPKGEIIGSSVVIKELVITNEIKNINTVINAKSKEDITRALDATLDRHYNTLQFFLKDNNRNLIILFLVFSIFIFVVCVVSVGINNNTLAKSQAESKQVETRMLFTLTENNKNLDATIIAVREEYNDLLKEVEKANNVHSLLTKALLEVLNKNYDNSIKIYSEALSLDFQNSEVYSNRAYAYIQKEMYSEAMEDLNKAINMNYDIENNYYKRATIHKTRKEWYEAIEDYSKTIGLNSNNLNAIYDRALCYYNIEEFEHALNDYTKVIELFNNHYKAYSNRAYIYTKFYENTTNKLFFDKALEDLNKAIEIEPKYIAILTHFAYLYMCLYKIENKNKKSNIAKAKKYLEEAATIDSNDKELYYYNGMYNILTGKESKGLKLISTSAEMGYDEAVRYMLNNNASILPAVSVEEENKSI